MLRSLHCTARLLLLLSPLLAALPPNARAATTIELVAEVDLLYPGTGPNVPVQVGELADITIAYDEQAVESAITLGDPVFSMFPDSLLGLDIYFRTSDLLFSFGSGGLSNGIQIQDNAGLQGVALEDNLTLSSSDPIDTPLIEGLEVFVANFAITESINAVEGGGTPDMLIQQDLLPQGPLDLASNGRFITLFTLSLEGQSPSGSVSFANVQYAPEPAAGLASATMLLALAALRKSARRGPRAARVAGP